MLVTAQREGAAAGYREMPLRVTNCGAAPVEPAGRPEIVMPGKGRDILDVAALPGAYDTR